MKEYFKTKMIMNKVKFFIGILGISLILSSCYYDVEEELYGIVPCDTSNVTYTNSIRPILENNCLSCHSGASPSAGIDLDGYGLLSNFITNGKFKASIEHQPGVSPMPKNAPKLSDCDIAKVRIWIEDGALNN